MDDLLDLDWAKSSSAANPNKTQQSKSYSSSSNTSSYNFDALTRSMPANGQTNNRQQQQTPIPARTSGTHTPVSSSAAPAPAASGTSDAFSSLLSFGGSNATVASTSSQNGMTMAQRQQLQQQPSKVTQPATAGWAASNDGWDAFESNTKPTITRTQPASKTHSSDPFDFSQDAPPRRSTSAATKTQPIKSQPTKDPFDFSDFEDPGQSQSSAFDDPGDMQQKPPPRKQRDIDFFDDSSEFTEGANHAANVDDADDDLLGALGRPVEPSQQTRPKQSQQQRQRKPSPSSSSSSIRRKASPPPHLLGRIVEMGFSPFEARDALAKTETGLDVEAALEMLLNGASNQQQQQRDREYAQSLQRGESEDPEMDEYEQRERERARARRAAAGGAPGPTARQQPRAPRRPEQGPHSGEEVDFDWQKQADALYSQASEFSANMFTKANAFWSNAKTQAQKALEERNASSSGASRSNTPNPDPSSSGRASPAVGADAVAAARAWARRWGTKGPPAGTQAAADGRPRWMVEAEEREQGREDTAAQNAAPAADAFKDSDNEDEPAPPFIPPSARRAKEVHDAVPVQDDVLPPRPSAPAESQPSAPPRRAAPGPRGKTATASKPPGPAAAPAPKRERTLAAEDLQPAGASAKHKDLGNVAFKRGAYGEAEAAYTAALETLGATSLRRIPLLNNRANARLKNGDAAAASRDCSSVLALIVEGKDSGKSGVIALYVASAESSLPPALATEVNLRDAYAKALNRRAQSYEMLERWLPAMKDWTLLEKFEKEEGSGAGSALRNLKSARDGIQRCKGMVSGGGSSQQQQQQTAQNSQSRSTPASRQAARSRQAASNAAQSAIAKAEEAGRQRVRAVTAAQQAEEAAAHSLKDAIDAKITAWKAGKETNIRALLASLENVVWPELGWKKVGMHEVITDAQVKKQYTKAMVKLHPDKVSCGTFLCT